MNAFSSALALATLVACVTAQEATHGAVAGDVTSSQAIIWSRGSKASTMTAKLYPCGAKASSVETKSADGCLEATEMSREVEESHDFTGQLEFENLCAATCYAYEVSFGGKGDANATGEFRTAPAPDASAAVKFAFGGDIAGQNACRDAERGYPIFETISNISDLDFFFGLGDNIYADGTCEEDGIHGNKQIPGDFLLSATLEDFWAHWKYSKEDDSYRNLLSSMAYYIVWDDHEVVNNFGPFFDTRDAAPYTSGEHLMPMGLQAYLDYNPIRYSEDPATIHRNYRSIRYGKHMEMFLLDTRQYRDHNFGIDSPEIEKLGQKTMLGREQLVWLKEGLVNSGATWKIIVSSVPISIPTGADAERDGWCSGNCETCDTGFESEFAEILTTLKDNKLDNLWITTDVHFASAFKYTPWEGENYSVHEIVTGPLNAGLFPNADYDTTFGTEVLFGPYGPEEGNSYAYQYDYETALKYFNFGVVDIAEDGHLSTSIINTDGEVLFTLELDPSF